MMEREEVEEATEDEDFEDVVELDEVLKVLELERRTVARCRMEDVVRNMTMGDDFVFDFDDFETALDVICFLKEKLSHPALISFLSSYLDDNNLHSTIPPSEDGTHPLVTYPLGLTKEYLNRVEVCLMAETFPMQHVDYGYKTMDHLLSIVHKFGNLMGKIVPRDSGYQFTNSERDALRDDWNSFVKFLRRYMTCFNYWRTLNEGKIRTVNKLIDTIRNISPIVLKDYEGVVFGIEDSLQYEIGQYFTNSTQILLMKAFPALLGLKESSDTVNLLLEVFPQLIECAEDIVRGCRSNTMIVLIIGSLLSFKPPDKGTWGTISDQLREIANGSMRRYFHQILENNSAFSDPDWTVSDPDCTENLKWDYFSYCVRDLSDSLQQCFCNVMNFI